MCLQFKNTRRGDNSMPCYVWGVIYRGLLVPAAIAAKAVGMTQKSGEEKETRKAAMYCLVKLICY